MRVTRAIVQLAALQGSHAWLAARPPRLAAGRGLVSRGAGSMPTDEQGWMTQLSPDQFAVLRKQSTEPSGYSERTPGQLEYELKENQGTKYPKEGTFECAGCGTPLYSAISKFDSG
mmetsp:Transcript_62842/g.141894  ORF Transcript_62842/g.141894 Transcript_62842/m.141894 type:complete len:116 (+) Transcript_62842:69-416(+)